VGLKTFQIWGSNTGVGKTLLSGAIARQSKRLLPQLLYLKPVQTGFPEDDDAKTVRRIARRPAENFSANVLVGYQPPVSPHRAWKEGPIADEDLLQKVANEASRCPTWPLLVETAGGVLSPAPSGRLQADVYRPLRMPALLVGDGRLGGISATLSSYEALRMRGYSAPFIFIFGKDEENHLAIERNVDAKVFAVENIPESSEPLDPYFATANVSEVVDELCRSMCEWWKDREKMLAQLPEEAMKHVWWPFTQHHTMKEVTLIDSAHGDDFTIATGGHSTSLEKKFDACGSWWTNGLGHGNSKLSLAASYAGGRYGHVIFPEVIHEPAMEITKLMLDTVGKGWADRVFFSDNGSTAVEVGLKMVLRKRAMELFGTQENYPWEQMRVISFEGSYHGDTLGVMDCSPGSAFNALQTPWYKPRGIFVEPPTVSLRNRVWTSTASDKEVFAKKSDLFNFEKRSASSLAKKYVQQISSLLDEDPVKLGALVMEPVLQGAGGMRFVDPLFQRMLADECRKQKIPILLDEVFTGLWRLGSWSAASLLGIKPDVSAFAKLVTGGMLPLAMTLASEEIFKSFEGTTKREALLHGHSYTAHPMGCQIAVAAMNDYRDRFGEEDLTDGFWDTESCEKISMLSGVLSVTHIGTVLAVELRGKGSGYAATGSIAVAKALKNHGVYARPLGNIVYIMCSPITPKARCAQLLELLETILLHKSASNDGELGTEFAAVG